MPLSRTATLDTLLHLQTFSLSLFKKYLFIYLAALGLSYGMWFTGSTVVGCGLSSFSVWI